MRNPVHHLVLTRQAHPLVSGNARLRTKVHGSVLRILHPFYRVFLSSDLVSRIFVFERGPFSPQPRVPALPQRCVGTDCGTFPGKVRDSPPHTRRLCLVQFLPTPVALRGSKTRRSDYCCWNSKEYECRKGRVPITRPPMPDRIAQARNLR